MCVDGGRNAQIWLKEKKKCEKKEKDPPLAVVAMQFIACPSENKKKITPNEELRSVTSPRQEEISALIENMMKILHINWNAEYIQVTITPLEDQTLLQRITATLRRGSMCRIVAVVRQQRASACRSFSPAAPAADRTTAPDPGGSALGLVSTGIQDCQNLPTDPRSFEISSCSWRLKDYVKYLFVTWMHSSNLDCEWRRGRLWCPMMFQLFYLQNKLKREATGVLWLRS